MDELEQAVGNLLQMVSSPKEKPKEIVATEPSVTPVEEEYQHDSDVLPGDLQGALDRDLDLLKMNMGIKATPLVAKRMAKGVNLVDGGKDKSIKTLTVDAFEELYDRILELSPTMHPRDRAVLTEFLMTQIVEMSKKSFYIYVKYMAHHILPEGFIDGKHIKLMADELQKVEQATFVGKPIRQMIFCPPGAMKSKINNLFISWVLGRHPKWNILHIGHGTKFVEDNAGRPIRDLMRSPEYLRIFPEVKIKIDSRAAGRWELTKGGRYYGAGVGTQIAGRRAHIAICDDVVSEQSAYSIVERRAINAWYVPGLRTRLLPNGSEIIVNTRWVVDDLSGFLEINDKKTKRPWNIIKIPAILDEKASKLLGLPEGGSFWPEFQTIEFLQERRDDPSMTASKFSALYMQEPIPEEGSIFKESDFQMWSDKKPPDVDLIVLSLDTAYSVKTSADFSAYSVWGVFMEHHVDLKGRAFTVPNLILIECDKKRWEYPELVTQVKEMHEYYKPDIILVENKASGQSLIPELRLMGYPVVDFNPNEWGDKVMRANQVTPYFRNGRVWVPDSQGFSSTLVRDALEFPFGPSDDLVDTMTQAIIYLRQSMSLSTSDHMSESSDPDEDDFHRKRKTYWNSAAA
jgi:predicted phage terminase large subunit-like protein